MSMHISTAPHIRCRENTMSLMRDVLIALLPTAAVGIYMFGYQAALVLAVSTASAVLAEYLWQKLTKRKVSVGDLSAAVTGLILGLNLPSSVPLWMPVIGSAFAIIIAKQLFGGIGDNFINPALAARAVLVMSWPKFMLSSAFKMPHLLDGVTAATPLAAEAGTYSTVDLLLGVIPGTIGEVCKVAILLGLVYLLIRRVITWRIPVVMMASAALFTLIFGGDVLPALLSGGLLFGAVFMATDYTTSPMTAIGQFIYAAACGLIVVLIRTYTMNPEGVTYSILFMNIVTPLIDKYVRPKIYGEVKAK